MQNTLNKNEIIHMIRKSGTIERLNLITDIWDEIKECKELELVSDDEKRLLLNRLANYHANPDSAIDWEELKKEVYQKYAH